MSDNTYNGYTNYETWNVALHISNEQSSQELWQDRGKRALAFAKADDTFTKAENAAFRLRERLKDQFEEQAPTLEGTYGDLLQGALSAVNWYEIAENIITDLPEQDDEEDL